MTKTLLALALSIATLVASSGSAHAIPVVWGGNGHLYEVVLLADVPWGTARSAAQALGPGWDLATITSAGEQAFIAGLLGPPPSPTRTVEYWVGGFQSPGSSEPGGSWQWINGEGLFWDNGPVSGVFARWGNGEPNNLGGENHLAVDNRFNVWGWNDNDRSIIGGINGYVAEWADCSPGCPAPSPRVPAPSTFILLGIGLLGMAAHRLGRR